MTAMSYLEPSLSLLLLLAALALARVWRRGLPPWPRRVLALSLLGIGLFASNWVAVAFAWPLQRGYPRTAQPADSVDAIVVLSGAADRPTAVQPYAAPSIDTYRRLSHAVWLSEHWRALPILVCGGSMEAGQPPLADTMRRFLETAGIPATRIWTETRSHSTHENAEYGADVLRAHGVTRVALIVEAISMPRAAAAFEKAGLQVVPVPIRFLEIEGRIQDVLPGWRAMARNDEIAHEVLGLLWYRLRGWI
jgi:uncharacterized SAM-binding protein YcdF (DUF218 family)